MRTLISGHALIFKLASFAGTIVVGFMLLFVATNFARADQAVQLTNGTTITLSVIADGSAPFGYQWQKNGINIAGANQSSLVLPSVSSADAGNYTAVVTNSAGSTTSDIAIITAATVFAPAIIVQPVSQSVVADQNAILLVIASGSEPLSYQWKKSGVDIAGATSSSLPFEPVTSADFGTYTVVVSNAAGTAESVEAFVTDSTIAPFFPTQLAGQSAQTGDTVTFSFPAGGTTPISYQWRINGRNLDNSAIVSGATTSILTLTNVNPTYTAQYSVIATNAAGSVESNRADLTVSDIPLPPPPTPPTPSNPNPPPVNPNLAPTILTNPVSRAAAIGETLNFSASATGIPDPSYQWQKDGVNLVSVGTISGANTPNLTLFGVRISDAGEYRLVATNSQGSATSEPATLLVKNIQVPLFINQPVNQQANVGSVVFFSATVSAFPAASYQWRKNGVDLINGGKIQGANKQTLSISNLASSDAGTYSLFVSNAAGTATSNNATLTTDGTPAFTGQPSFVSQPPATTVASAGAIVQLVVNVAGDPLPTLQWRKNGVNLVNGGIVSGATSATLTLTGVTSADAGTYTVVATNSLGAITSSPFDVSILPSNVWNQPATTGKDVALAAPSASTAVQWQVSSDVGSNWSNLANDSTYSGVATSTLHIANVSPALNTLLYRLVTVVDGKTTVLHSAKLNVVAAFVAFPVSLSTDGSGNLYVADVSSDTIHKINGSSQIETFAGTAGQTGTFDGSGAAARFNDPSGIASAFDGTSVVADKANGTIRLITSAGVVSTLAGSTTLRGNVDGNGTSATFSSPAALARDSAGNVFVADAMNHTIRKITSSGTVSTLAGSAGQAGTSDGTGNSARFNNPSGIDVDSSGNVFVADTTNNLVRKITSNGTVTTVAGLGGVSGSTDGAGNVALFNQPSGVAVDSGGNVYVADTGNSTIRRISPAGIVVTVAGLPGISGHKDGVGIEAWFNQPRDVVASSSGIYVADTGNSSIRKIDSDGKVTTLALMRPTSTDGTPNQPLPPTPTLPNTPSTPTLPTSPTAPTQPSSGGGGGGGAPSVWFLCTMAIICVSRLAMRPRA